MPSTFPLVTDRWILNIHKKCWLHFHFGKYTCSVRRQQRLSGTRTRPTFYRRKRHIAIPYNHPSKQNIIKTKPTDTTIQLCEKINNGKANGFRFINTSIVGFAPHVFLLFFSINSIQHFNKQHLLIYHHIFLFLSYFNSKFLATIIKRKE